MRHVFIMLFLIAAAVSSYAQVNFVAYPAAGCAFETDFIEDYQPDGFGGVRNNSGGLGARARRLHCPVPSSVILLQREITAIRVDVDDRSPNGSVAVSVCARVAHSGATQCSTPRLSGNGLTSVVLSAADTAFLARLPGNVYAEVRVDIPQKSGDNASSAFGLTFVYSARH